MTTSTSPAPDDDGKPADVSEPKSPPAPADVAAAPGAAALTPAAAPQIPDPAATDAPVTAGGVTVTETGTVIYPQPMKPAREGYKNLATVPPMGSLTVPPLEAGGETAVIDVYGTEVDDATAERAYAAASAAGLSLREL